jgi:hypothetical protein
LKRMAAFSIILCFVCSALDTVIELISKVNTMLVRLSQGVNLKLNFAKRSKSHVTADVIDLSDTFFARFDR